MLIHICHAAEKFLLERHGRSTTGARHGHDIACVNQTRPHCVKQTVKTQSKPLATRHGMCVLALTLYPSSQ